MKAAVNPKALVAELRRCQKVVNPKDGPAALHCIHLDAVRDGTLRLTAARDSLWYETVLCAQVIEEGTACADATELVQAAKVMQGDVIISENVRLQDATGSEDITGIPPAEFPELEPLLYCRELRADGLLENIARARPHAWADEIRHDIHGVLVEHTETDITHVVATDTHTLYISGNPDTPKGQGFLIPLDAAELLPTLLPDGFHQCVRGVCGGNARLVLSERYGGRTVRIMDQSFQFPNWRRITDPGAAQNRTTVQTELLRAALARVARTAKADLGRIRLEHGQDGLMVSADSGGRKSRAVAGDACGALTTMHFDYTLLDRALASMGDGEVTFRTPDDPLSPAYLSKPDAGLVILMPMKAREA